jgi:hypothetical protein
MFAKAGRSTVAGVSPPYSQLYYIVNEQHYSDIMSLLLDILGGATSGDCSTLKLKAMEYAGSLGSSLYIVSGRKCL